MEDSMTANAKKASINPLVALKERGQSVWLDFLSRAIIRDGHLARLIRDDGLGGVTANPAIFEKAIGESDDYDDAIARLAADTGMSVTAIYEHLAVDDIRAAADLLRPVYDANDGRDGFVSLEVSPYLAMDTAASIAEARRLWDAVARPNLMIKIPGTRPGLPAIRALLADGINVNITLLFSQDRYEEVVDAYLGALEDRATRGQPIDRIASVASFFVSRIDSAVDKLLAERIERARGPDERATLERLRGRVAIANARLAYRRFRSRFSGPRWEKLAERGARPQRLLWASTGTKDPAYSDVLYVEELIGPDTVNTVPEKTMDALRDHGKVRDSLVEDVDAAGQALAALDRTGISLAAVTDDLVTEGVRLFCDAFDRLMGAIAGKRARALGEALNRDAIALDAASQQEVERAQEEWRKDHKVRRLWGRDAVVWTGRREAEWLGWLDVVEANSPDLDRLKEFARDIRAEELRDAVVLGMGGSSLGAEVLAESLGSAPGFPRLHALDSTDPRQVAALERNLDPARTLFMVSSKSGTTLEPNLFMDYFLAKVSAAVGRARAGRQFVAITDPGTRLEADAREKGFRQIFHGVPSIGGRYSVLSSFGLVPLAAAGHDVGRFLAAARAMARACGPEVPPAENPGVRLGLTIGVLARRGRDKVTLIASPSIASFGAWAEQLLAESTGKQGRGLIPVDGEPLGDAAAYGSDRLFIHVRDARRADTGQDRTIEALRRAGHPVVRIDLAGAELLGQEFFRWELATAVAGAVIGIDPFDQPDVEASKVATRELTDAYEKRGSLPDETPVFRQNGIALFTDEGNARALRQAGAGTTLESWLGAHFARLHDGDYFAILAYVDRNEAHAASLSELRTAIRNRKRVATCVGFGPRFLHSTGQAYKGGPNSGVFLQITHAATPDLAIPGRKAGFGVIEAAQARGDFDVLAGRGRRLLRAHLAHNADLDEISDAAKRALA
jgi:transaldolase/glucose-6-phosphate isomerase